MNCKRGCKLFGAYRVVISIKDSAVLIHSTVGCNWGTLAFHIPSQINDVRQASTVIYEEDIINGGEKLLYEAIDNTIKLYESNVIYVITGCVPEIMNDNAKSVVSNFKGKKKVRLIEAPGFEDDDVNGQIAAFNIIINEMEKKEVIKDSINLVGFLSDDYKINSDLENILELIPSTININAIVPYDYYEKIMNVSAAALNVVLEGFEIVGEVLKEKFNTPYIVVKYPYGIEGSKEFVNKIGRALGLYDEVSIIRNEKEVLNYLKNVSSYISNLYGMPVAIVGDTTRINGLKSMLENELGMVIEVCIDIQKDNFNEEIEDRINKSNAIMIFGCSFEEEVANKLDIPILYYTYPVFDKISFSPSGYAGFKGFTFLIEDIINLTLLKINTKREKLPWGTILKKY